MGGLFPLLITKATLEKPVNFSGINTVPQHQDEIQGYNAASDGPWEEAPECWLLVFLGHEEVQEAT